MYDIYAEEVDESVVCVMTRADVHRHLLADPRIATPVAARHDLECIEGSTMGVGRRSRPLRPARNVKTPNCLDEILTAHPRVFTFPRPRCRKDRG